MKLEGIGLVCSGGVSQSSLARMPALLARLGPIKAPDFRLARQIANSLRAGYAASHYSVFETCPMVWFAPPEHSLDRSLREFGAQAAVRGAMVVLFDYIRDSRAPSPLSGSSLRVASLNPVPGTEDRMFAGEGHPATLRALRLLLAKDRRRLIELNPGGKPLFFAGIHAVAPLLMPWLDAGIQSLRACGFTRARAAEVGELLGVQAVRSISKSGLRAWNRKTVAGLRHALEHDLDALRARDPALAQIYEQGLRIALKQF